MAGHWYNDEGEACFEIKGANGKLRATTIRDAKKYNWFPSVTTVLDVLAKPGLLRWQYRQITDMCFDSVFEVGSVGECKDIYNREMVDRAFKQVKDAADAGTLIHNALEKALQGEDWDKEEVVYLQAIEETHPMKTFVEPVELWVLEQGIEFTAHELRLVNIEEGYAGTTDCAGRKLGHDGILDFKTKKTKKGKKLEGYPEQREQIAAYAQAHYKGIYPNTWGCNLFISTTEPGRIEAVFYTGEQLKKSYGTFLNTCAIWRDRKEYDCRRVAV